MPASDTSKNGKFVTICECYCCFFFLDSFGVEQQVDLSAGRIGENVVFDGTRRVLQSNHALTPAIIRAAAASIVDFT